MINARIDLDSLPTAVEEVLGDFFATRIPAMDVLGEPVVNAAESLRTFVQQGGKRLRPTFAWTGYAGTVSASTEEESPEAVLRAVSSLELIQACALIHDDIIDSSDTRRGNPTVHKVIGAHHAARSWRGDAHAFGEHVAILIGDLALAWADDMVAESGLSCAARDRAYEAWRDMRSEVIGGQILDISLEASGDERVESANTVNRFKTAAYTIERPLHFGALIAGAGEETITALRAYGRDIGIAFQLRDDILGVFGDAAETGKPVGDDLSEGKRTVLVARALEALDAADPDAAATLRDGIGAVTDAGAIAELSELILRSGAVDRVEEEITALTHSGLRQLEHAEITEQAREDLHALAVKATARKT